MELAGQRERKEGLIHERGSGKNAYLLYHRSALVCQPITGRIALEADSCRLREYERRQAPDHFPGGSLHTMHAVLKEIERYVPPVVWLNLKHMDISSKRREEWKWQSTNRTFWKAMENVLLLLLF